MENGLNALKLIIDTKYHPTDICYTAIIMV